jgi:hypothetical protein
MEQLLLIQESREDRLEREVKQLREQCEKIRKSQYAKIGELNKLYFALHHEYQTLKLSICSGKDFTCLM